MVAKASYRSNDELFQAVRELIARWEQGGHGQDAATLREGFACLNGLTDGWAMFLESIERVQATAPQRLDRDDQQALKAIRAAVHAAVRRR